VRNKLLKEMVIKSLHNSNPCLGKERRRERGREGRKEGKKRKEGSEKRNTPNVRFIFGLNKVWMNGFYLLLYSLCHILYILSL
jgi:hypothetical protein